jgi:hypothetical protein
MIRESPFSIVRLTSCRAAFGLYEGNDPVDSGFGVFQNLAHQDIKVLEKPRHYKILLHKLEPPFLDFLSLLVGGAQILEHLDISIHAVHALKFDHKLPEGKPRQPLGESGIFGNFKIGNGGKINGRRLFCALPVDGFQGLVIALQTPLGRIAGIDRIVGIQKACGVPDKRSIPDFPRNHGRRYAANPRKFRWFYLCHAI